MLDVASDWAKLSLNGTNLGLVKIRQNEQKTYLKKSQICNVCVYGLSDSILGQLWHLGQQLEDKSETADVEMSAEFQTSVVELCRGSNWECLIDARPVTGSL